MRRSILPVLATLLVASLAACTTHVPPAAVAWRDDATVLRPSGATRSASSDDDGYLKVETDTDISVAGALSYDYLRRPYDLYSPEGALLRADVNNRGPRNGQDPRSVALPPGQYVVASVYGAVYRKVQVEVRPRQTTVVPQSVLSRAPAVFAR